ncbi:DUF4236 domain-containing protein [Polaromonas sp.]|uniref:DUF4236 domain-containing protein n=1 Tax=Polaromonas sp. TaxID=1869339 RepID=UPI003BB70D46
MAFRFQKRIKLMPGVTINLSKKGVSTSLGVKGARVTYGHGKRRTTVGIPGSGISHTTVVSTKRQTAAPGAVQISKTGTNMGIGRLLSWVVVGVAFLVPVNWSRLWFAGDIPINSTLTQLLIGTAICWGLSAGLAYFLIVSARGIRLKKIKDEQALQAMSSQALTEPEPTLAAFNGTNSGPRIRLTNQQITALMCATFDRPIYGENPSFLGAQMPDGGQSFHLKTIESLVKRQYLVPNNAGGYLLTAEGQDAVKSASGF